MASWFPRKSEDTEADNEAEDIDIAPIAAWPEDGGAAAEQAAEATAPPPSSLIMVLKFTNWNCLAVTLSFVISSFGYKLQ